MNRQIASYFPFSVLDENKLLRPERCNSTYEFYLLENLTDTLVATGESGFYTYSPSIASSWKQLQPNKWQFQLDPNRKYSDGSTITINEYAKLFKDLISRESLHHTFLRNVKDFSISNSFLLTIDFKVNTNHLLLHELSLADSGLIKTNEQGLYDWTKTLGPYYLERYSFKNKTLTLKSNTHSKKITDTSPNEVTLLGYAGTEIDINLVKNAAFDIYYRTPYMSEKSWSEITKYFKHVIKGQPTVITYFAVRDGSSLIMQKGHRRTIRNLIQSAIINSSGLNGISENQIIPFGYEGRLINENFNKAASTPDAPIGHLNIKINTPTLIDSDFSSYLIKFLRNHNIDASIVADDGYDIYSTMVQGNQKMSIGTLQFLAQTSLRPFADSLNEDFNNIINAKSTSEASEMATRIHNKILNDALLIPLIHEPNYVAHSNRVSLSKWNTHDMRMRFYEISVKE